MHQHLVLRDGIRIEVGALEYHKFIQQRSNACRELDLCVVFSLGYQKFDLPARFDSRERA